jgi:enoyl-CoA hydratase/carnithine racemase
VSVTAVGVVHVIDLGDGDNRLTDDVLDEFHRLLDELEHGVGARALVTRGSGKVWSNGLDIEFMARHPSEMWRYLADVERLLARVIVLGLPTIAAITGHAFGAGAMLALCHDMSVMRSDRGYWCLPEVELGMDLSPGEHTLVAERLLPQTRNSALLTGRRFTAAEALAAGIVDETADEDRVVDRALEIATERAPTAASALEGLKRGMYGAVADALLHDADEALAEHRRTTGQ